mmetsp:Transcript_22243/g.65575  ORF Transcript_22243/g.65575 Transcript_22243/m.65575 type:complete len:413 (+) Transcript_22243:255-1493(+)
MVVGVVCRCGCHATAWRMSVPTDCSRASGALLPLLPLGLALELVDDTRGDDEGATDLVRGAQVLAEHLRGEDRRPEGLCGEDDGRVRGGDVLEGVRLHEDGAGGGDQARVEQGQDGQVRTREGGEEVVRAALGEGAHRRPAQGHCPDNAHLERRHGERISRMLLHEALEADVAHAEADGHAEAPEIRELGLHGPGELEEAHARHREERRHPRARHKLRLLNRREEGHEDHLAGADEGALIGARRGEGDGLRHVARRHPRAALRPPDDQVAVVPAGEREERRCREAKADHRIVRGCETGLEDTLDDGEIGGPADGEEEHHAACEVGTEHRVHLPQEGRIRLVRDRKVPAVDRLGCRFSRAVAHLEALHGVPNVELARHVEGGHGQAARHALLALLGRAQPEADCLARERGARG